MTPTMFQIAVAIVMVAVTVAIFVWLQRSQAAASARRMTDMMARVGVDPGSATRDDARTRAVMKETRQRCRRCPREDRCERWLAGEIPGSNAFCPNAQTFDTLSEAGARAG